MTGYIARAACRGHRPSAYDTQPVRERPRLLRLLLKERGVARFIVAPDGYGKTSLALSYAETITSWTHTFWLNAQSPCFLRDLDQGTISSDCLGADPEAKLVVFDDVPALDSERARRFSQVIDLLISRDCEVLVTCVPMCDTVGPFQIDRVKLCGRSLLLDDDEVNLGRLPDERVRMPAELLGSSRRVPGLEWVDGEDGAACFAKAVLAEEVPPDLALVMASVLVLGEGAMDDLRAVCPSCAAVVSDAYQDYPHLGFEDDLDEFRAPDIPVASLAVPVKKLLSRLVAWSSFDRERQLVGAWAAALMQRNEPGRACEVVQELCPRLARANWLVSNVFELVGQGCFLPVYRLAADYECQKGPMRMRLWAISVLCRRMLGDIDGAVRQARRRAFDSEAPHDVRTLCSLVLARNGSGPDAKRALDVLAEEAQLADAAQRDGSPWPYLAKAWCACVQGPAELLACWHEFSDAQVDGVVLKTSASWLFGRLEGGAMGDSDGALPDDELCACERYVRHCLAKDRSSGFDYYAASAGLSLKEAHDRGFVSADGPLSATVAMKLRDVQAGVLEQYDLFQNELRAETVMRSDWAASRRDILLAKVDSPALVEERRPVPTLMVRTFGMFEVMIGDKRIDEKRFGRRNSRLLLVMLAANQGKEVMRETVASSMWPGSTEEVARKNFYSVWSYLRRAVTLPDGTCPYLARHQFGCSLDMRYVQTDIERFNEICRELLFGVPQYDRWMAICSELEQDFSSEFMPAEQKNGLIVRMRNEYRSRLIDALVSATFSVAETENTQWAKWFARAALQRDDTREDAYIALMRAQIACNQRPSAIMTYLRCRRVLSERLGIDPSPEIVRLYETLLQDE